MHVHFLALGDTGWGEMTLALRAAADAERRGHRCTFTAPAVLADHVRRCGFSVTLDSNLRGAPFRESLAKLEPADLRVLVDLRLAGAALFERLAHADTLLHGDTPIAGIDTWHFHELGSHVDFGRRVRIPVEPVWRDLPRRLVPVPFVRPVVPLGCSILPETPPVAAAAAALRRRELGVGPSQTMLLVCTSYWQHDLLEPTGGRAFLDLVGLYLSRVPDAVVAHVGPEDLPWHSVLGGRYRRLAPMDVPRFEATVAAADLLVSVNPSATTNTTAMHVGTPVLTLSCSRSTSGAEYRFVFGRTPSPELLAWLRRHHPVPRSAVFPLDFTDVMARLLASNPYTSILNPVELLDEQAAHDGLVALARPGPARDRAIEAQSTYSAQARRLTGPGRLLEAFAARDVLPLRPARPVDARTLATFVDAGSNGFARRLWSDEAADPFVAGARALERSDTDLSFRNAVVVDDGNRVIAAVIAFPVRPLGSLGALPQPVRQALALEGLIPDAYLLHTVGVDPAWRGRGLGTRMVREAARRAHVLGHAELGVVTDADPPNALRFYRSLGFEERARGRADAFRGRAEVDQVLLTADAALLAGPG
jgi:ribosomal protein S18 acetylase RimI-like enzyme